MNRASSLPLACGAACLALLGARGARGEVREAALRVEQGWRAAGATVSRDDPRFLSEDETVTFDVAPGPGDCVGVAIVGARGMSFHARVLDPPEEEDRNDRLSSVAGVLEISRCGGEPMRRVAVKSDAGRGVLEAVIARSRGPLPSVRIALPERTGGTLPTPPEPGGLPPLPSPAIRADIAEARAMRDGGKVGPRDAWEAGADGTGEGHVMLDAGCHRIELFAVDPRTARASRRFKLDLDAELRGDDGETLLARDRTDAPDARLELCVGVATAANVVFAGSPPTAPIVVTQTTWAIPERLPLAWGQETRARMAWAMLARHLAPPKSEAVFLAQGPSGSSPVPVSLEPGACYVAVAGIDRGHARGIGLRVRVGARAASDDRGINDESALVSFCAEDRDRALLEVEARGVGIGWGMAVFRLASGIWESGP